jgi:hypothetical protein
MSKFDPHWKLAGLGMVAHFSNPSYSGGGDRRITVHDQPGQKKLARP